MNDNELLDSVDNIVVPDSVDPYIGWKALRLDKDGVLRSPSFEVVWPAHTPLVASCNGETTQHRIWQWAPIKNTDGADSIPNFPDGSVYLTPAGDWTSEPPIIALPPGYHWGLQHDISPIVSAHCSCGIYAVDNPDDCEHYLKQQDAVLVKVALWGRLIRGTDGARGQYAYPQQIVLRNNNTHLAQQANDRYTIPVIFTETNRKTTTPKEAKRQDRSKYLKPSFQHVVLTVLALTVAALCTMAVILPPVPGFVVALLAGIPLWLIGELFRDWDSL